MQISSTLPRLAAGLALCLCVSVNAWSTSYEPGMFKGVRVSLWDCPATGCGPLVLQSGDELGDFLRAEQQRREEAAWASTADGASGGRNDDDDDDDDDDGDEDDEDDRDEQVVFVDFNNRDVSFTVLIDFGDGSFGEFGTFTSHLYTPEEQATILARLRDDYKEFDIEFTDRMPNSGPFTTLLFNDNDDPTSGPGITLVPAPGGGFFLSIGFGLAENIDFRNSDRDDNAGIDANFWEFLAQLDPSGGLLESFSGLPIGDQPGELSLEEALSLAVTNQSANTGAHELGHILGLRHHDSFGAPGDGLPFTGIPDPLEFVPVLDGQQNATETVLHLMASGASVGLTLTGSTITDRFLSERSAVKVSLTERGKTLSERKAKKKGSKRKGLRLPRLEVPNTLVDGVNAGTEELDARALVINGSVSEVGEADSYRFFVEGGRCFNAELVSFSDDNFLEPVVARVQLFREEKNAPPTLITENFQTFEPFDPLIFDIEIPSTGTYVLSVDAPDVVFLDLDGQGLFNDPIPLSAIGAAEFLTGDYELLVYEAKRPLGDGDDDDEDDDDEDDDDEEDDD